MRLSEFELRIVLGLPLVGLVYSPVTNLMNAAVILGFCARWELNDADVEHFSFSRLWRFLNSTTRHWTTLHWVDISFVWSHGRTSLGNWSSYSFTLLLLTDEDPLEFIWVDSCLVTITTFFDGLEGYMGRLAIVVRSPAEHLSLNPCLCQTVCDVLNQFSHLNCSFFIWSLLVEELEHLGYERFTDD